MIVLQLSLFLLLCLYAGYIYLKHTHEKKTHQSAQQEWHKAQHKLSEAAGDFNHIEKEIFELIDQQFDGAYSTQIKNGIVDVGMPVTFLTMAWGHPQRIERLEEKQGGEHWFYKEQDASGAQTQVVIANQQVVKLKDL